ncbi:MAG: SDR family NAD(P)-dependent oxidoreductase [Burkholderiaceae bacterium]|nr:SDR family NAD(P)-dependent oxidoreductase [Burkholderiaceae bacterium]
MIPPRQFRRLRIALIGFGDVAGRLLAQRQTAPGASDGPRFFAIGRNPSLSTFANQHRSIQRLNWNLDQADKSRRTARIADAAIIFVPPSDSHPSRDLRMQRFVAMLRAGHRRIPLVYISTTGVYGDTQGGVVTEVSPCRACQPRSRRRVSAEQALRPLGACVLRAPGIYAQDRLPTARLAARQPALREEDDVYTNHIHAEDLARLSWVALFRGHPGRVINAVDETGMKMADYFDAVADATGLPRPPRISREDMLALGKTGQINPMMMSFLSESRRVRTTRIKSELVDRLRYPTVYDALATLND